MSLRLGCLFFSSFSSRAGAKDAPACNKSICNARKAVWRETSGALVIVIARLGIDRLAPPREAAMRACVLVAPTREAIEVEALACHALLLAPGTKDLRQQFGAHFFTSHPVW